MMYSTKCNVHYSECGQSIHGIKSQGKSSGFCFPHKIWITVHIHTCIAKDGYSNDCWVAALNFFPPPIFNFAPTTWTHVTKTALFLSFSLSISLPTLYPSLSFCVRLSLSTSLNGKAMGHPLLASPVFVRRHTRCTHTTYQFSSFWAWSNFTSNLFFKVKGKRVPVLKHSQPHLHVLQNLWHGLITVCN